MAQNNEHDFDEQTSHLGQALEELEFPADRSAIVSHARSKGLDSKLLSIITDLPDRQYVDLRDVLSHFIGGTERTVSENEDPPGTPG